jgi:hypothetical protein
VLQKRAAHISLDRSCLASYSMLVPAPQLHVREILDSDFLWFSSVSPCKCIVSHLRPFLVIIIIIIIIIIIL